VISEGMTVHLSRRLRDVPPYAFAEIRRKVARLESEGVDVIDLGIGDPVRPTPECARAACVEGIERYKDSGYPPYEGTPELREAAARYMQRHFGVEVDPAGILATDGSKEAIFHLPEGLVDPGDVILAPSPGYIPYYRGAAFAEAECVLYPLDRASGYLPDADGIARTIDELKGRGRSVRLLWICYPNAPTGAVATRDELARVMGAARGRGVVVASDEAYTDFVWEGEQVSALECGLQGIVSFFSLSKRSNMTGYRVGWAAGDPEVVGALARVKTNLDSGTPCFVQSAAAAALGDEAHVEAMRAEYRRNLDALAGGLRASGLEPSRPAGALYVWQKGPEGMTSEELCRRLLAPEIAVAALPGTALAPALPDGRSPGEGYVRFSLTALPDRIAEASRRMARSHGWLTRDG